MYYTEINPFTNKKLFVEKDNNKNKNKKDIVTENKNFKVAKNKNFNFKEKDFRRRGAEMKPIVAIVGEDLM